MSSCGELKLFPSRLRLKVLKAKVQHGQKLFYLLCYHTIKCSGWYSNSTMNLKGDMSTRWFWQDYWFCTKVFCCYELVYGEHNLSVYLCMCCVLCISPQEQHSQSWTTCTTSVIVRTGQNILTTIEVVQLITTVISLSQFKFWLNLLAHSGAHTALISLTQWYIYLLSGVWL